MGWRWLTSPSLLIVQFERIAQITINAGIAMKDLSFIIPIRVDTEDRLDNCLTILRFLQLHFPEAEVLLMEQDAETRTDRIIEAFPGVRRNFEPNPGRFSKSLAVNHGVELSTRPLICMCDTDILLHPDAIRRACRILRMRMGRVVIPHNRIFVDVSGELKSEISASLDMNKYGRFRRFADAPAGKNSVTRDCNGGIFLAEKEVLQFAGGLNRKMISYGWEDTEFIRRLDKLGYYTFMLPEFNLVHLDHRRGADSRINEMFDVNRAEFEKVNAMNRRQLQSYIETDLDITPESERARRHSLRRRQAFMNFIACQWLAHVINKIQVNLQINGMSKFLRKFSHAS